MKKSIICLKKISTDNRARYDPTIFWVTKVIPWVLQTKWSVTLNFRSHRTFPHTLGIFVWSLRISWNGNIHWMHFFRHVFLFPILIEGRRHTINRSYYIPTKKLIPSNFMSNIHNLQFQSLDSHWKGKIIRHSTI